MKGLQQTEKGNTKFREWAGMSSWIELSWVEMNNGNKFTQQQTTKKITIQQRNFISNLINISETKLYKICRYKIKVDNL